MKKLLSLLCMAACLFSLAACTTDSGNNNAALSESEQKSYNSVFEFFVEGIASTPDADVALILENEGGQYVDEVVRLESISAFLRQNARLRAIRLL